MKSVNEAETTENGVHKLDGNEPSYDSRSSTASVQYQNKEEVPHTVFASQVLL